MKEVLIDFVETSFMRTRNIKLQLHDAIYRLRFNSNSLIHILSLSNSHNNVASIQKNRGDESDRVIGALTGKHYYTNRDVSIAHSLTVSSLLKRLQLLS